MSLQKLPTLHKKPSQQSPGLATGVHQRIIELMSLKWKRMGTKK